MIAYEDILSLNFYKKQPFSGSYRGMCYRIQKDTQDDADVLRVFCWPGPYNFASTSDSLKTAAAFPFSEEGMRQTVDWLNEQWSADPAHFAR